MEVIKLCDQKYHVKDDYKIYSVLLTNGGTISCNCDTYLRTKDCRHIESVSAILGGSIKIRHEAVRKSDHYDWLNYYKNQCIEFIKEMKGHNANKNRIS